MNSTSTNAFGFAKSRGARTCTTLTASGAANSSIVMRIKEMYPHKTVQTLAEWLGISERTAKHRLGRSREFTVDEIAILLHSEQGFEIVAAMMASAPRVPMWWRVCAPVMEAADIRRMQMLAQRRIAKALEGALDADRDLTSAIHRAEALAVHDADHVGPHIDALRSMARVPHSAVASSKGRRR